MGKARQKAAMTAPIDRRPFVRCPHCGALIVWGRESNGVAAPFDVVSMKATTVNHLTTCKQIAGWSKK